MCWSSWSTTWSETHLGRDPDIAEKLFYVLAIEKMSEKHLIHGQRFPIEDERNWPLHIVAESQGLEGSEVGHVPCALIIRLLFSVDWQDFEHLKYNEDLK